MDKENKITINNLIYSLIFLVLGIILLTSTDDLITIVSKVIGYGLIIVGACNSIKYIYMKGKLGDYSISSLVIGLGIISCGILLVLFSSALSFAIRTIIGLWVVFASINRIIFAISVSRIDKKSFWVYFVTSFFMFALGVLLISGIFDELIGLLIIIYSVMEIMNYIYFKVTYKESYSVKENVKSTKKIKKEKRLKKGKIVDAVIEEDK